MERAIKQDHVEFILRFESHDVRDNPLNRQFLAMCGGHEITNTVWRDIHARHDMAKSRDEQGVTTLTAPHIENSRFLSIVSVEEIDDSLSGWP